MAARAKYSATTRQISVSVHPTYLDDQSAPEQSHFVWAYQIVIENYGAETVQLRSRHWRITNARGELHEVRGPGVVGEQPRPAMRSNISTTCRSRRRRAS
jgi:ApaG protein